jgi:uncharacterized membrane protein
MWTNSYWGGSLAAAAGCLVFGALPRIRASGRVRDAVPLGCGLALYLLIRQYESIFLILSVVIFLLPGVRGIWKPAALAALIVAPALGITLLQNQQVTGSWTTLPYVLSQYQYGVPAALTFQRDPAPHRALTPQQALEYQVQMAFRGGHAETLRSYVLRLWYRVRFYRFFFVAPLYLAVGAFLFSVREWRWLWVLLTVVLFALGINFFPAFQFHYLAAVTCLFILISVQGLERISRWHTGAAQLVLLLSIAQFAVWYGAHLAENSELSLAMRQYETWETINHTNPARRIFVNQELAKLPGRLLVFVRYWPQHIFQNEWVYNRADVDAARVVWARDLGAEENQKLLRYYPGRSAWLLEPDAQPPRLSVYRADQ